MYVFVPPWLILFNLEILRADPLLTADCERVRAGSRDIRPYRHRIVPRSRSSDYLHGKRRYYDPPAAAINVSVGAQLVLSTRGCPGCTRQELR